MAIVGDLFNPNPFSTRLMFQSNEDAKIKLDNFLNKKALDPMLLVLDDVWSDSFIEYIFPSKITGHKIVVTSRTAFPKYNVFRVEPLNEEDAKKLIRGAAFTEGGSRPSLAINEDLVNQMVPWCKNHPHTLSLVGGSLNGKDELAWKYVLKRLCQGRSVLDLHPDVLIRLERSFEALDDELKQCFLDFGLFPEDKRIAVSALLNMWVHLYGHDEDDTKAAISELSYRNLADLMTTRNHPGAIVNNCDQIFVTQPKYLRELAIRLNSKPPLAKRSRLIINARGENLPAYIEQVQEPMQAHILSISTEESFSSKWCNIEVPNVEVLILKSKAYTLPHFFAEMQNLKILDITNHDLCPTKFENFHFFGSLNNLTTIRLENVVISPSISLLVSLQKATLISCKIDNAIMEVIINRVNQQLDKTGCNHCKDLAPILTPLSSVVHLSKNEIDAFSKALKNLMAAKPPSVPCFEKSCEFLESFWELAMVMYNKIPMIGILRSHLKDNIGIHELQNTRAIESVAD